MKNITVYFLILTAFIFTACRQKSNNTGKSGILDSIGVYLPVEYITTLEKTKNNYIAMGINEKHKNYYVLAVKRYSIEYDDFFSEGWRQISVWDITESKFEYTNKDEWIFIDKNGNRYKKISDDIENWYSIHRNFIGNTILKELINSGDIIMKTDAIIIPSLNNHELVIVTWPFEYTINANLQFSDTRGNGVILEIVNNEYTFYYYDKDKKGAKIWSKKL